MKNRVLLLALLAVVGLASMMSSADSTHGAFHLMRVWGVMANAFDAAPGSEIQYVELRMTDPGNQFVGGTDICFYNAAGTPVARFTFITMGSLLSGSDRSILIGNEAFETAYSGTRDFGFNSMNGMTVTIPGNVATETPVVAGSGMVAFGSDSAATGATACQAGFTSGAIYDSVAYGPAYPTSDPSPPAPPYLAKYPPKSGLTLPTAGTDIIRIKYAAACFSPGFGCPETRMNSVDYEIRDANSAGNEPRNNAGTTGTLSANDADADGVPDDGTDECLGTAPLADVDAVGCSDAQVDADLDGDCDPGAESDGPSDCTLSPPDNCPTTANPNQENNVHTGTTAGDHCEDPDSDGDFDIADNCPDDSNPTQDDTDTDTYGDACDNCPNWSNPAQTVPAWGIGPGDPDCDGFTTTAEGTIGTDPLDNCRDDPSDDAWPADIIVSGTVNIFDLNQLTPPTFGTAGTPGSHPTIFPRKDIVPSGTINIFDLNQVTPPAFGTTCT